METKFFAVMGDYRILGLYQSRRGAEARIADLNTHYNVSWIVPPRIIISAAECIGNEERTLQNALAVRKSVRWGAK